MVHWTRVALTAAALCFSTAASASADIFIKLGGSGEANVKTVGDSAAGFSLADAMTGTFDGESISLLAPNTFVGNDNQFTANPPYFDLDGLGFAAGSTKYLLYSSSGRDYLCAQTDPNSCVSSEIAISVVEGVPEPQTWVLMLLGFIGLGIVTRARLRVPNASPC